MVWHFRFFGSSKNLKHELENRSIGRGENILSTYSESDINNIIKNRLPFTTEEERYEVYPLSKMPDFVKLNKERYSDSLII
ncbi:hypothetical protein N9I37_01680 [Candidatus Pelagibacter ubique]|nr:hypothetical protein [Candidatus Pelagibacter ubique]